MCGKLTDIQNGNALVELNGVTYEIMVAKFVEKRLMATGKIGGEVVFHTMHYVEGSVAIGNLLPRLVGFLHETDLDYFKMLITVQGLGVKRALRSLEIPVKEMARAIELNDIAVLKKLPEIGTKTAQKIIVELRGKVAKFALMNEDDIPVPDVTEDIEEEYKREAVEILMQLQYEELEAKKIVNATAGSRSDIHTAEELIQEIFNRQIS